jgi:hypothetical protein
MLRKRGSGGRLAGLLLLLSLVAVAVVVLSFGVGSAAAASTTVTCSNDGGSPDLQTTINSNAYSTISIRGTCVGNFYVDGSVTIDPFTLRGVGVVPTLDGNGSGPVLHVFNGANVTVRNLRVTNGDTSFGGGIDVAGCGTVVNLVGSTVNDNGAEAGGGVYLACGTLTMVSSHVDDNSAFEGGGIFAELGATVNATNSSVSGNSTGTQGFGGGIYAVSGSAVTLTGSSVSDNTQPYEGGGIWTDNSTVTLTGSTVSDNKTTSIGNIYGGGGIWMRGSQVSLNGSQVTRNSSEDFGGGIADYGGSTKCAPTRTSTGCGPSVSGLTITSSSIDHNTATLSGGGIYNYAEFGDSSVTLDEESYVSSNTVTDGDGGGVSNYGKCGNTASFSAAESFLLGNKATNGEGGAIYNSNGDTCGTGGAVVTLSSTQVGRGSSPNRAIYGAGIFNENGDGTSSVTLQQATAVTRNIASVDGGGVFNCDPASLSILTGAFVASNVPDNVVHSASCP